MRVARPFEPTKKEAEMPDATDSAEGAVQSTMGQTPEGGTSEGVATQDQTGGKNPDVERLEKRVEDLLASQSKLQSRADKAEAENKKLQTDVLSQLADVVKGSVQKPGRSAEDIAAEWENVLKRWEELGNVAILDDFSASLADVENRLKGDLTGAVRSELEEMKSSLQSLQASVQQKFAEVDPEYRDNKERVDAIVAQVEEAGGTIDRKAAIALAKQLSTTEQPARPPIPGGTAPTRHVDSNGNAVMSPDEVAQIEAMTGMKLTDATKRALAKKGGA